MIEHMTPAQFIAARWALMSEAEFQKAVIDLAHSEGWKAASFRPARVRRGGVEKYETPVGADGKGWVDLVLVRECMIFPELKSETGQLTKDQRKWRDWLLAAGADWRLWRPSMWAEIEAILKGQA